MPVRYCDSLIIYRSFIEYFFILAAEATKTET